MEWIGPVLIGLIVVSSVVQLFWTYALSVIAQKTGQSGLMQLLAWIPILQLAPLLAAGGGSIARFAIAAVGLVVGNGILVAVASALGSGFGQALAGFGFALSVLLCVFYFGQIAWNTAIARDRPGWVGLLSFIPVLNLFVYPYLAVHDGWTRPNGLGLIVGVVLVTSSTVPALQAARMLNGEIDLPAEFSQLAALDETASEPTVGRRERSEGAPSESRALGVGQSIRALYELKEEFETLDGLAAPDALVDPDQRASAVNLIRSLRNELESHREELDRETFEDLAFHLVSIEARVHSESAATPSSPRAGNGVRGSSPVPAAPDPAARVTFSQTSAPPIRPYPVEASDGCPIETELRTRNVDGGEEEWCQQRPEHGGLRHGWYARYGSEGRPESMGEYRDGLRVGVWTRFYSTGEVRAQVQFREGMQHGWLLTFDEAGDRTHAVRYDRGVATP